MISKTARRNKIKSRIRGKISGTAARPRMSVFRSNKGIYVQLIDDLAEALRFARLLQKVSKVAPRLRLQPKSVRR